MVDINKLRAEAHKALDLLADLAKKDQTLLRGEYVIDIRIVCMHSGEHPLEGGESKETTYNAELMQHYHGDFRTGRVTATRS